MPRWQKHTSGGLMPVPSFNANGILPPVAGTNMVDMERSPYIITMTEIVQTFGTTPLRRQLLRNLIAYRELILSGGYTSGIQFLDGSFVEDVERHSGREPRDIDVFTLLHVQANYIHDPLAWQRDCLPFWAEEIQNQPKNKQRYQLDTYATLVEEFSLVGLLKNVMYWYSLFSHQRDTYAWKGFVAVMLDAAQDEQALILLGEQ